MCAGHALLLWLSWAGHFIYKVGIIVFFLFTKTELLWGSTEIHIWHFEVLYFEVLTSYRVVLTTRFGQVIILMFSRVTCCWAAVTTCSGITVFSVSNPDISLNIWTYISHCLGNITNLTSHRCLKLDTLWIHCLPSQMLFLLQYWERSW